MRVDMFVLLLLLEEKLSSSFAFKYAVSCGCVINGLYYVEMFPIYQHFWKFFKNFLKFMLNFVKRFFCICWDDHLTFILHFVNVVYHIDWFADIKESLHSWDKAHLIMVYDFFNMSHNYLLVAKVGCKSLQWRNLENTPLNNSS